MTVLGSRKWLVQVEKPGWEGLAALEVWAKTLEEAVDRALLEAGERDRLVSVGPMPAERGER